MEKRFVRLYDVNYIDMVDYKKKCVFELTIPMFNELVIKDTIIIEGCTSYFVQRDVDKVHEDKSYTMELGYYRMEEYKC